MDIVIRMIVQLVAGAIGGHAAGASMKHFDLGRIGNTIVGAIGGLSGGQILEIFLPVLAGAADGGVNAGALISQTVASCVGGAILTVVAGMVRNMMAGNDV
jgi:uncharacterized membrane protein YeaQ/YmgE (transglycosylase-associated protein family)